MWDPGFKGQPSVCWKLINLKVPLCCLLLLALIVDIYLDGLKWNLWMDCCYLLEVHLYNSHILYLLSISISILNLLWAEGIIDILLLSGVLTASLFRWWTFLPKLPLSWLLKIHFVNHLDSLLVTYYLLHAIAG